MKTKWSLDIPAVPGWYWCKYRSKHGGFGVSIAEIVPISGKPFVSVHRVGDFNENTRRFHRDVKFGPPIPLIPEAQKDIDAFVYLDKRNAKHRR